MEKFGEIMKSCLNCNDLRENNADCLGCNIDNSHINGKPVEIFKPLHMVELNTEDYEVTTQADGLVELMTKVDEVLSKDNAAIRFDGITGTVFDNETQQIPEPTNEQIQNYNTTILKQLAKPHGRTHYYKFTLDFCEDYSIRFFLEFSDRKDYEQNWYLKSHKLKEHTLLTKEMAEDLIRKSCTTFVEEIIGRRVGKKYEKIVVSKDKLVKFTE